MGDHYIPQYYLRGFLIAPREHLWCYDKLNNGNKFPSTIKNIAHENRFYSHEIEKYLANTIEGPANLVLQQIRERHQINDDDKNILAKYMTVMYKRVPQGKQRLKENAPRICNELLAEYNKELDMLASEEPGKVELIEKRRAKIQDVLERYSEDPPKEVWLQMIPPEMSPRIVDGIRFMTWTFLTFDEKPVFLTCDNPLFYFLSIGIGKPNSEITFPISSNVTLLATWRSNLPNDYIKINMQIVKELNRRTTSNASRFVYSGYDEPWISSFVAKGDWQLSRLI
jgi:hypothetical protein